MINQKIRGKSNNIREIKDYNTINVDRRSVGKNKLINFEKENEDLKKKLSIQKQLNERLTRELQKSKRKSNGNITPTKSNSKIFKEKKEKETNNKICLSKEEYNLFRKQQIIWKFIKIVSIG